MTLTSRSFDVRTVLTGAWGGNVADEQGADPWPSRIPSPDHGDGIDFEPDDASGGVVIATYDGSDDAAPIGSLSDAFSGAGQLPAHVPATSGPASGWSPPPSQTVPPTPSVAGPTVDASSPTPGQNLFSAFGARG